jgi:AAHS family 4-hydroxybenzoate transporter-like MFS transporter
MTQVVFDVSAFINSRHVGAVQYGITILCGLMMFLDGLLLSPLSDRFGHRRLIIISTVAFALLTLITVLATSVIELIALRFVTGIALGATIPSAVALTTEYSPKRLRATFVLAIYCGFSLGFVAAGGLAAWIIPLHGWRSLLWTGAIAPLTLAVFVFIFLPESLDFLVRTNAKPREHLAGGP